MGSVLDCIRTVKRNPVGTVRREHYAAPRSTASSERSCSAGTYFFVAVARGHGRSAGR